MTGLLALGALFAIAFLAIDHRLDAPFTQRSILLTPAAAKREMLDDTSRLQIAFGLLLVAWLLLIWTLRFRSGARLMPIVGLTLAWLGWEACSLLWSADKMLSLRSLIPWIITAAVGFVTGSAIGANACVAIIALVSSVFLLVGYGNEWLHGVSVRQVDYRFGGTLQPNRQGINCAMLALSTCYLGATNQLPSAIAIAGVIAGAASLALTRSRTPFWGTEAAAAVWVAVTHSESSRVWASGLFVLILLAGVVVSRRPRAVSVAESREPGAESREPGPQAPPRLLSTLALLGRPPRYVKSLNNRTTVWRILLPRARQKWIIGDGFSAFWDASRLESMRAAAGRMFTSCHSTFVEIFLRSGAIGVILFVATVLSGMLRPSKLHQADGAFLCALFIFVLFQAFVESIFAQPNFGALFLFLLLGAVAAA